MTPELKALMQANERRRRHRYLKGKYDLTIQEYEAMAKSQGDRCACCGDQTEVVLHVDHDHDTGAVRALLCTGCNTAIGSLKDSSSVAEKAAAYLRRFGK